MVEVEASAVVGATPKEVFAKALDLEHADWLPVIEELTLLGEPPVRAGSRFSVQMSLMGRATKAVLICREYDAPHRAILVLEEGFDLSLEIGVDKVAGGCEVSLFLSYHIGGGFKAVLERASESTARRQVRDAVEQFAAQFPPGPAQSS